MTHRFVNRRPPISPRRNRISVNKGPMFVTTLAQIANRSYDYNGRDNVYYPPMQYKRFRYFRQYEYSPRTIRGLLEYKPIIARPLLLPPLGFKWFFFALHSPSAFSLYFPPFFIDHRRAPFAFFRHLQKCWGANRSWTGFPFDFFVTLVTICAKVEDSSDFIFMMINLFSPNSEDEIIII